jgi:hypothetical protein
MLERDAAFPGDEVVLAVLFGLGEAVTARHFDAQIEKLLGALWDRGSSSDDAACVEVDDVGHAFGELRVGRDLDDRRNGITGGRAKTGGKEDEVGSCAGLSCYAFDVVAGSAEEREAGSGGVVGKVEDISNRGDAAFASCAGGFDGVSDEAVFDIAG